MPANEQTWRNPKLMHLVFAISAIAMLITTIWMMADDHNRPWKDYQRTFHSLDVSTTRWRAEEQDSADYEQKLRALEAAASAAKHEFTASDAAAVDKFFDKYERAETHFFKAAATYNRENDFTAPYSIKEQKAIRSQAGELANESEAAEKLATEKPPTADKAAERTAQEQVRADRQNLLEQLDKVLVPLRFREDLLTRELKDKKAYFGESQSRFDQAVGRDASPEELKRLQDKADENKKRVAESTDLNQQTVEERKTLEASIKEFTSREDAATKKLADHKMNIDQLHKAADERASNFGKGLLESPILDAFNSPLKIENRWLPQLPWNNNFRDVARFDRCETCHQGMERSAPGAPTLPAYPPNSNLTVDLSTPPRPKPGTSENGQEKSDEEPIKRVKAIFGLALAPGVFSSNDVTVAAVYPPQYVADSDAANTADAAKLGAAAADSSAKTPSDSASGAEKDSKAILVPTRAASAGLVGGDVIEAINGAAVHTLAAARGMLLDPVNWGDKDKPRPIRLSIRRGVPQPFTSHPRLDLFVGSLSPHPVAKFGCTACHGGQGSATSFKWSSHSPNNIVQGEKWSRDHEWFNNENWTYPMFPKRFAESACLKCHHEVVDLEASHEFPDPPAPKLVDGYETIRRYGCFGCHEINGYDGPNRRVGPDVRLEPNYAPVAAQLLADKANLEKLSKDAVGWAREVVARPENDVARRRLLEVVGADAKAKTPTMHDSRRLEGVLKDSEMPGALRKVGPSLRHVGSKLSFAFMTDWINNPQDFRPDTRMPRFFGLWDHLDGSGLEEAQRYEPVEIRAITEFLLKSSQPFEYAAGYDDKVNPAALKRGKKLFATRGCLACHQHADFKKENAAEWQPLVDKDPADLKGKDYPLTKATQGPDLSRIGAKLSMSTDGRNWLDSWVREPSRYHARTLMPNLFLETTTDAEGKSTDPAADVTEYLMSSQQDWKPDSKYVLTRQLTAADEQSLADLALLYLAEKFPGEKAQEYLRYGIPASQANVVVGDEAALVNPKRGKSTDDLTAEKADRPETSDHKTERIARLTEYVGRRSIGKYGCFGCHDIPGYEDAKPIGTALADWGRKLPSRLAFEQIAEYVTHYPNGLPHGEPKSNQRATDAKAHGGAAPHKAEDTASEESKFSWESLPPNVAFFTEKLLGDEREGFLWQKLREPRSYDFRKTENKKYNERLRMPKFHFAVEEKQNLDKIEQVMTFVLGLVAEPPPTAFVNHPSGSKEAIYAGRKVLEKYNCAGCHMLEMERWDLEFKSAKTDFGPAPDSPDFAFAKPHFTSKEIDDSKVTDRRGIQKATLIGMPRAKLNGAPEIGENTDEETNITTVACTFMPFQPAVVGGDARSVGKNIDIPLASIVRRYPARGGDLARFALPIVVADEPTYKEKPNEAWGWLPPPLIGEGRKVQSGWLHDFLLNPFSIRPAAVLRMPKFNMSSAEASKLVAYFAAIDGAEYPYEYDPRATGEGLETKEQEHGGKYLESALGIVTDNQFCIKCHKVGDFSPTGTPRAMAPRLDQVHSRLRPEYAHRWIANPPEILPYTGMPVNFPPPPAKTVAQDLFKGTSEQQIDGLVDLLMNFDRFAQTQMSIKARVKPAPAGAAANASDAKKPADEEK